MRVLVGLSGGVDSSVAAALMRDEGHEVVGVTLKLWGGRQDSGCCSIGDVEDARRVAQQLDISHHVFNFTEDFDAHVVAPYIADHALGLTPNPCIECNRHLKFDRLLRRADQLGFDAVATGHHARVRQGPRGRFELLRGFDAAKDQSYVLHMLDQSSLQRVRFPVGEISKSDVRAIAARLGLRTAAKPESQDTCFISAAEGREAFLAQRMALHPAELVDVSTGTSIGQLDAVELVTVGQRRGVGGGNAERRYVVAVDAGARIVHVGRKEDLMVDRVDLSGWSWVDDPVPIGTPVRAQTSAHGMLMSAVRDDAGIRLDAPRRRPAPGQSVVLYDAPTGRRVLGGATATANAKGISTAASTL